MFSIKTIGHAASVALHDFYTGLKAVEKVTLAIANNKPVQTAVEAVTAATFGPSAVEVERGVFAITGELAAALQANDAAVTKHLVDAGLDVAVVNAFKQLIKDVKLLPATVTASSTLPA